jgi:uncharacterized protein (TIGR03435 family)
MPLLFLLVAALTPASQAQDVRQFEAVSIKPSKPGAVIQDMRITLPPGRIEAVNITLNELLSSLTGFSGRVEGGPKWAESERYDIVAKANGEIAPSERNSMVIAMLEDRFKLVVHHEAREVPGFALMAGKQPPNLDPAKAGEKNAIRLNDRRQVVFQNVTMSDLANYLRSMWGDPVVDRTGLTGHFDFSIEPNSFADASGESFSARIRPAIEALGFRVQALKLSRDITIIDHVERPTEN